MAHVRNSHPSRESLPRAESRGKGAVTGRRSLYLWVWLTVVFLQAALTVSAQAQTIQWIRQFGSGGFDRILPVATDASGNVYVAGGVAGALPGQTSSGGQDAYVRKYDASGTELWTRQFGTSGLDEGAGVFADSSGVYVVGPVEGGTLPGQTSSGGVDAFIRKYDANGNELWTRQFGTSGGEGANVVFADGSSVYVVGWANGALPGQTSSGGDDAFIRKYDASGTELWTRQFGSSNTDYGSGVTADASGVYVGGVTFGALPGQSSSGDLDVFIRKYDASGNELWTQQFGTSAIDSVGGWSVFADSSGVYVGGFTGGTLPGQTNAGDWDAFIRKCSHDGTEQWTRQFGTSGSDTPNGLSADGSSVYVGGQTTGTLPGQTNAGSDDTFVRKFDSNGNGLWTRQFGTTSTDHSVGVSAANSAVYIAVQTLGTFPSQTSAGNWTPLCGSTTPVEMRFGRSSSAPAASIILVGSLRIAPLCT